MNLNPIVMLRHPIRFIGAIIEKPNFRKAFFIVLLPTALYALFNLLSGLAIDVFETIKYGATSYLAWIIIAAIIYFVAFLAKGKEIRGKFLPILCAISIIWLLVALLMLVTFVAVYSSPKIFALMMAIRKSPIGTNEVAQIYSLLSNKNMEGLKEYASAHGINLELSDLPAEADLNAFYNTMLIAEAISLLLLFYIIFVYPLSTIKAVTKLGYAQSFVWYLISSLIIVPCLFVLVLHA